MLRSLGIIPLYLWCLVVFLLPGFAVTIWLASRRALRGTHAVILLFVCGGAAGYLAFWIYFANKLAGKSFSYAVTGGSLWFVVNAFLNSSGPKRLMRELRVPLLYLAVIGACYLSLLFVVANPFGIGQDLVNWRFFTTIRPGDNVIPWIFGAKIYGRQSLIPFCCGGWLSSDRPPLQAGIYLFFWPLKLFDRAGLNHQLLGSGLQCSWCCGVWALVKTLGASERRVRQLLGLLMPSAFLFYNTVYTWPKLLAATFILFAVAIFITALVEGRPLATAEVVLAAGCVGLALMAHPGSVFSLPIFGVAVLAKRDLPWRGLAWGALILLCFAAPWAFYQKYVDPPGNRLLKIHLAGVFPVDSRGTWQSIKDSYESLTWKRVVLYKWKNITDLVGPEPVGGLGLEAWRPGRAPRVDTTVLETARAAQRDYIWSAIGILNAGWLAALFLLFRRRGPAISHAGWLLLAGVINLIFWCLVMFGPAQTVTAHSSYADILLIMIGLAGFLLALPRWIPLSVMVLEILNIVLVWLPFRPASPIFRTAIQWPLVAAAIVLALGLLVYTLRAFRDEGNPERG